MNKAKLTCELKWRKVLRRLRLRQVLCLLSIVILMTPLGGCSGGIFRTICPPLTQYSKEFQAKAAAEKRGPATQQLVSDYGQFRDACRALL